MNTAIVSHSAAYHCVRCKKKLHARVKRNVFIKTFLFFLPIKIYFCSKCLTNRYFIH